MGVAQIDDAGDFEPEFGVPLSRSLRAAIEPWLGDGGVASRSGVESALLALKFQKVFTPLIALITNANGPKIGPRNYYL